MLTVINHTIRTHEKLYSLNDLHKVSGGKSKHSPFRFMRLKSTKDFIDEIKRSPDLVSVNTNKPFKVSSQGTWVCKELIYAYTMWVSPYFHLIVVCAFDSGSVQQQKLQAKFNQLYQEFKLVSQNLSNAGRYLNYAGKKVKPELKKQIDDTLKHIQLSLDFNDQYELLDNSLGVIENE